MRRDHHPPMRHQREHGRDRGHTRSERQRVAALQTSDGLLEGRPRGVVDAGVAQVGTSAIGRGQRDRHVDGLASSVRRPAERDGLGVQRPTARRHTHCSSSVGDPLAGGDGSSSPASLLRSRYAAAAILLLHATLQYRRERLRDRSAKM